MRMIKRNTPDSKASKIIYWVATSWLALGMLSTGIVQLIQTQQEVEVITHLGYPVYFLIMIAIWKILGVAALLVPKFSLLKEWAYAGFFFAMSGAIFSHLVSANEAEDIFGPLLLLILTTVSWYFRPTDRKIIFTNQ
jgi:hypothetical protein